MRRAYFDRTLGRLAPARAALPAEYGAALAQRNAALRRIQLGLSSPEALTPWTEQVAELGAALVDARRDAVALLSPTFAVSHSVSGRAVRRNWTTRFFAAAPVFSVAVVVAS